MIKFRDIKPTPNPKTKQLEVRQQNNYGTIVYYPTCEAGQIFAAIAGTESLTESTIRQIVKLGYTVKTQVQKTRTWGE